VLCHSYARSNFKIRAVTISWDAPDLVKASQGTWHASRLNRLAPCCSDDHEGDGPARLQPRQTYTITRLEPASRIGPQDQQEPGHERRGLLLGSRVRRSITAPKSGGVSGGSSPPRSSRRAIHFHRVPATPHGLPGTGASGELPVGVAAVDDPAVHEGEGSNRIGVVVDVQVLLELVDQGAAVGSAPRCSRH
jgi:hypothetical protein